MTGRAPPSDPLKKAIRAIGQIVKKKKCSSSSCSTINKKNNKIIPTLEINVSMLKNKIRWKFYGQ